MKKILFFTLIFTLWILTTALSAATISDNAENPFVENAGQHNFGILFSVGVPGGRATVSQNNDIAYRIGNTTFTEKFEFLGDSSFKGIERSNAVINIYKENFTATGIPAFKSLSAQQEGISLTLRSSAGTFEKIFTVNPGTDPCSIKISVNDAELIENIGERLAIHTGNGTASFSSPVAWQETGTGRQNVEVAYVTNGKSYGFAVGNYDPELPLFIDPLLTGVFIGGNNSDEAIAINVLTNGDIVIAGTTSSNDFPVTDGSTYKNEEHSDCVIMKYDPSGTTLKAATYFGGSRSECSVTGTDDDETNLTKTYFAGLTTIGEEIFLVSTTYSPDLPVTDEAYDKTCGTDGNCNNGQADAFIAKFNEQLVLEAATYYGGSGQDRARAGIGISGSWGDNFVFIAGDSNSIDLPSSMPFGGGDYDAFVASFTSDLKTLNISRMIGGNNRDKILAITSDASGASGIYVTGITGSSNFPVTKDGYDKTLGSGGMGDVFVSNLDFYTLNMDYSTLFGGNWTDYGYAIAFYDGSVYIAGATYSEPRDGFPVTAGAYQTTATTRTDNNSNWRTEGFIARFSRDLSTLESSTYLGSAGHDDIKGIAVLNGKVVVAGFTDSTEFPVTENAFDTTHGGGWDGFISVLSSDLTTLSASTFIGGTGEDRLFGISFDAFENPVAAGFTTSSEIPGITGVKNGSNEMIFLRIAPDLKDSPDAGVLVALDFIDFGEKVVESSSWPRPVELRNVGGAALNISAIDLDDTVNFNLTFDNYLFSCSPGISIAAGTYCLFEVSMTPQVLGTIEGIITVSSDAGPDLKIHLTGIGKEYQEDVGDTSTDTVGDSGDSGDTGDTSDTGDTGNTGDTGDTTTDDEKSDDETDLPKTKESGCSTIII
ncbi:MAG TPA: hypothetical protein VLJ60_04685 [bacterium]|nr:hypothetical protein [bacterium]